VSKAIALSKLGKIDHPKVYQQDTLHTDAKVADFLTGPAKRLSKDPLPVPVLGGQSFTSSLSKTLALLMSGLGKFKLEHTDRRPLRTYLEIIGPFIRNSRLDYQAALSIFRQYIYGTLLGSVEVLFKKQAPF
jgi:hypothetical protein